VAVSVDNTESVNTSGLAVPSVFNGDFEEGTLNRNWLLQYSAGGLATRLTGDLPGWSFHGGGFNTLRTLIDGDRLVTLDNGSHAAMLDNDNAWIRHNRMVVPDWADVLSLDLWVKDAAAGERLVVRGYLPGSAVAVELGSVALDDAGSRFTTRQFVVPAGFKGAGRTLEFALSAGASADAELWLDKVRFGHGLVTDSTTDPNDLGVFFTDTVGTGGTPQSSQWVELINPFAEAFTVTVTVDPNNFLLYASASGDVALNDEAAHAPLFTDYHVNPGDRLRIDLKSKFNADFIKTYVDSDIPIQKTNLYFTITQANGSIIDQAVDLFYMPDFADGDATDGVWTFMDTLDGKTRKLHFDNAAHLDFTLLGSSAQFSANSSGGIVQGLDYLGLFTTPMVDRAEFQIEEGGRRLGTIKVAGESVPMQTIGISFSTMRTMVQTIRTELANYTAGPGVAVTHDPQAFAAGKYNIFGTLFPDPVITDAQWADVVKGFHDAFGKDPNLAAGAPVPASIYIRNLDDNEFGYGETGLNLINMINRPWNQAADPNDNASRSFAGLDFAYDTFEQKLTVAGAGAGSFGGMKLRDDLSIAAKRYWLSEVLNPERAGAKVGSTMNLVVDGILRAYLGAGFTRQQLGSSLGWVLGHELGHNMGLFDEYIYNPFQSVPRDGGANFMSTANTVNVSNRLQEAKHLLTDNPDTVISLAGTNTLANWFLDLDALDKSNRAGRLAFSLAPLLGGEAEDDESFDPLASLSYFMALKGDASAPVTGAPTLLNGTPAADIVNGRFDVADPAASGYGWITYGNATVDAGAGVLAEDPRLASRLAQSFVVPDGAVALRFVLLGADFVANAGGPADAFEVALLDASGNPVAGRVPLTGSDALFNLQGGGATYASDRVSATGLTDRNGGSLPAGQPVTVSIDLGGIAAGTPVTLYFDLLGFGDAASRVRIDDVRLVTTATPDDLPPVARTDSATVDEDGAVLIDVLANDSDPEGQALTLVSTDGATHGSLAIEAGQVRYTPQADWFGDDAFSYVVRDAAGNTATGSVTVTVRSINDLPLARPDTAQVAAGGSVLIDVLANDSDPEGTALTLLDAAGASHGTLAIENGQVRYTPEAGFAGADSFSYRIADADSGEAGTTVSVAVLVSNLPPLARGDSATLDEDGSVLLDVLANDSDPETGPLSLVEVGAPSHGRAFIEAGRIRYTPDADWHGSDSFRYTVADALGATADAVVELTVTPVNDAPTLAAIADGTVQEGEVFSLNAAGQDVDGDVLSYALDVAPDGASIDPVTGAIRWTASDGDADYAFTVRVSDTAGGSATRSFAVHVTNVAPTLLAGGLQAVYVGEVFTLELSSSDPGADTLTQWRIDWGDGSVTEHAGNPPSLTHTYDGVLGRVLIRASATDEDGSYALDPLEVAVLPKPLQVRRFSYDDNGFAVRFNDPFDASVINVYDSALTGFGVSDIVLSGAASGVVKGSVVFDADGKGLRYLASGGGLVADSYSLVLKSGPAAFHSAFGNLDGNGDGSGGDDYLASFTLGPVPALRLSLPDFMRGPGQAVNVPATASLLPLTLASAGDVRNLSFTVRFDPALLQISGAQAGSGLPAGASLTVDTTVAGQITVTIATATPIAAGRVTLVNLLATVPATAPYGALEVVDIGNVFANQSAADRADDDALHVVGYIGDTNRNAKLDKEDVTLVQRNVLKLDSGFAAWRYINPLMVGDVDGDGRLSTADASRIGQKMNGYLRPEIPDVPTGITVVFAPPPAAPTLPQIDFGSTFSSFTVDSTDPKFRKENWKKAFVTNMANASPNPNATLKVSLDVSVQSTSST